MTALIPISTPQELAIALAITRCGAVPAASTTLLVASTAEVAEYDTALIDRARELFADSGVRVSSLNRIIRPLHPLDWRATDLSRDTLIKRLAELGVHEHVEQVVNLGIAGRHAIKLGQRLGAESVLFVSRAASVLSAARRRPGLTLSTSARLVLLARLTGLKALQIPSATLAATRAEVGPAAAARRPGQHRHLWPKSWRQKPAVVAQLPQPRAEAAAELSLAFVVETIRRLDRTGDPT